MKWIKNVEKIDIIRTVLKKKSKNVIYDSSNIIDEIA